MRPPIEAREGGREGGRRGAGESGFEVGYDKGAGITLGGLARPSAYSLPLSNFPHAQMDLNGGTSEWPISRGSHAVFVNLRELETFKTNLENVAYVLWETANHATVKRYICTRVPARYDFRQPLDRLQECLPMQSTETDSLSTLKRCLTDRGWMVLPLDRDGEIKSAS